MTPTTGTRSRCGSRTRSRSICTRRSASSSRESGAGTTWTTARTRSSCGRTPSRRRDTRDRDVLRRDRRRGRDPRRPPPCQRRQLAGPDARPLRRGRPRGGLAQAPRARRPHRRGGPGRGRRGARRDPSCRRHGGARPDRGAAGRPLGREGAGLRPEAAARPRRPPARPRRRPLPRARSARAALPDTPRLGWAYAPRPGRLPRRPRRDRPQPRRRGRRGVRQGRPPARPRLSRRRRARAACRRRRPGRASLPGRDGRPPGARLLVQRPQDGARPRRPRPPGRGAGRPGRLLPGRDRARPRRAGGRGGRGDRRPHPCDRRRSRPKRRAARGRRAAFRRARRATRGRAAGALLRQRGHDRVGRAVPRTGPIPRVPRSGRLRPGRVTVEVRMYTAAGCHLCEEAAEVLERARGELGFHLVTVDITGDPELEAAYREQIPLASDRLTVGVAARLSRYLQVLTQAKKQGRDSISSQEIGEYTNINATQIRRDLSGFGKFGKRGVGYNIDFLIGEIRKILRTSGQHNIVLIGAGSLGQAISKSSIFADHGFNIVGIFDNDPAKVGTESGDVRIQDMSELTAAIRDRNVIVGVLAVPEEAAQDAADLLVRGGVKIIFNYSEALIDTPPDVTVHRSSPVVEILHALYFHLT